MTTPRRPTPAGASDGARHTDKGKEGIPPSQCILKVGPARSGPHEAILLRRLQALDARIVAVQVQDFYFLNIAASSNEGVGTLTQNVADLLQQSATPWPHAPLPANDPPAQQQHHHQHLRAYAPRPSFRSVWSSNVRSILEARGVLQEDQSDWLQDLELGRWYRVVSQQGTLLPDAEALLYDRMTECPFRMPATATWGDVGNAAIEEGGGMTKQHIPEEGAAPVVVLPLHKEGPTVLHTVSEKYGLGLGPWEVAFLTELFVAGIGRDPTEVEILDVAQSLSEH
jgi:hypothetical protein